MQTCMHTELLSTLSLPSPSLPRLQASQNFSLTLWWQRWTIFWPLFGKHTCTWIHESSWMLHPLNQYLWLLPNFSSTDMWYLFKGSIWWRMTYFSNFYMLASLQFCGKSSHSCLANKWQATSFCNLFSTICKNRLQYICSQKFGITAPALLLCSSCSQVILSSCTASSCWMPQYCNF